MNDPIIHAFEPNTEEFEILNKKFQVNKNIHLNNIGVSEISETRELNVTVNSGNSSFYKINKNTDWIKLGANSLIQIKKTLLKDTKNKL